MAGSILCFRPVDKESGQLGSGASVGLARPSGNDLLFFLAGPFRALAFGADTNDAQQMLGYFKTMLSGHRVLNRFKLRGEELNDSTTL